MFRSVIAGVAIVATSVIAIAPVSAQVGRVDPALKSPALQSIDVQYRRYPGYRGRYHHGHRGGFPVGAGIAAGIAAGALLGGALSAAGQPVYAAPDAGPRADADDYCASRFRSYDPSSGTYMGYDGVRRACP